MKTLDWQRFFDDQRTRHGKVVFSVAELANSAQTSLHNLNTELGRLVKRGVVARYAQGRYGPVQGVAPEAMVSAIDPGAYITGFYALFRHSVVTQAPFQITCFTNRRHNRTCDRTTPAGTLRFICVPKAIYTRPSGGVIAGREQALCDFVWLNQRQGADPRSLVTFRNHEKLNRRRLNRLLGAYPESVRNVVNEIASS